MQSSLHVFFKISNPLSRFRALTSQISIFSRHASCSTWRISNIVYKQKTSHMFLLVLSSFSVRLLISDVFNFARACCRSAQDGSFLIWPTLFFVQALLQPSLEILTLISPQFPLELEFATLILAGAVMESAQHSAIAVSQLQFWRGHSKPVPTHRFFCQNKKPDSKLSKLVAPESRKKGFRRSLTFPPTLDIWISGKVTILIHYTCTELVAFSVFPILVKKWTGGPSPTQNPNPILPMIPALLVGCWIRSMTSRSRSYNLLD